MKIVMLKAEGQRARIDPDHDVSVVAVKGNYWYETRANEFKKAFVQGHQSIGILVHTVELYHRPHWNGQGEETKTHKQSELTQHGMWQYLERLSKRYAHVYVPSLDYCRPWCSHKRHPIRSSNAPTIPLVAVYRLDALAKLDDLNGPVGLSLCHMGYDSFTVQDFFYHNTGPVVLDETGSATSWQQAYEKSMKRILA